MQGSVLVILFSIQVFHHCTSKHIFSGQINTSDGHGGNAQLLCSVTNPGFSLKGQMAMCWYTEDVMSEWPSPCPRIRKFWMIGSVMMWGDIAETFHTNLLCIHGNLTANRYINEIFQRHVTYPWSCNLPLLLA